jgi:ABC-2 type transport system ATP-binding protein
LRARAKPPSRSSCTRSPETTGRGARANRGRAKGGAALNGPAAIELHGLRRQFGTTTAVAGIDLEVRHGEVLGFLGPNGAGKTTTMRMIAALLSPSAGSVRVEGFDTSHSPLAVRRAVGFVPESPFLYDKLTGREFLAFSGGLFGVRDAYDRAEQLLRLFELDDRGNDLIEGYSRGMRQKIGLAGVLMHDPTVLLLDEPTNALDPRSARLVKDLLVGLRERGSAIMLSTHVLEIAEQLSDRVAIIDHGRIVAQGTLAELRAGGKETLEDVFLRLTGGVEEQELARFLAHG